MKYIASAAFLAALLAPTQQACSDHTTATPCSEDVQECDFIDSRCQPRTCTDFIFDLARLDVSEIPRVNAVEDQKVKTNVNIIPFANGNEWVDRAECGLISRLTINGKDTYNDASDFSQDGDKTSIINYATKQLNFAIDLTTSQLQTDCVQQGATNEFICTWIYEVFSDSTPSVVDYSDATLQAQWTITQSITYDSETSAEIAVTIEQFTGDLDAAAVEVVVASELNLCTDDTFATYAAQDPNFTITLGDIMFVEHKIVSQTYREIMNLRFKSAKLTDLATGYHITLNDQREVSQHRLTDGSSAAIHLPAVFANTFTLTVVSEIEFGLDEINSHGHARGRNDYNSNTDDYRRRFLTTTQTFNRRALSAGFEDNSESVLTLEAVDPNAQSKEDQVAEESADETLIIVILICSVLVTAIVTIGAVVCYRAKLQHKNEMNHREQLRTQSEQDLKSSNRAI